MLLKNLSPKQAFSFNKSNARLNIWEGSVRSGKSLACLLRFMKELKDGPQGSYVVCGKSERTVLHNIIEPLQALTGNIIRYNRGLGEFTLFEKKVYVIGANDERAEGKIRGSTFAGALVDEITIIPEGFFKMLLSRLSVPQAKLFGTTNPDSPYHWLKTDFIDSSDLDIRVFKFTLEDNPSLTKEYKDNLTKEYKGLWHKRFIQGNWVLAEGAIYDFFDTNVNVVSKTPSYAKYYLLGIDYGTTNPFAAVLVGFNDDYHPTLWIEKEYYWDSKAMGYQKTDSDYAQDIQREFGSYPVKMIYLDPAAASFEIELKRHGKTVKQAKNDVIDGIRYISSLFTNGDLVICNSCHHLIKEIEGYIWDVKKIKLGEDAPLKQRDHACDAMRYVLFSHFGSRKHLKENQEHQKKINPMQYSGWGPDSWGWQRY